MSESTLGPRWQVGEMVRAVIEAARVEQVEADALVVEVGAAKVMLPLDDERVEILRMAPVEWPPRLNDVWGRDGERWFTVEAGHEAEVEGGLLMISSGESSRGLRHPEDLLQYSDGPLTLLYREGWTPSEGDHQCLGAAARHPKVDDPDDECEPR